MGKEIGLNEIWSDLLGCYYPYLRRLAVAGGWQFIAAIG
jgi:hypothetical protein